MLSIIRETISGITIKYVDVTEEYDLHKKPDVVYFERPNDERLYLLLSEYNRQVEIGNIKR